MEAATADAALLLGVFAGLCAVWVEVGAGSVVGAALVGVLVGAVFVGALVCAAFVGALVDALVGALVGVFVGAWWV